MTLARRIVDAADGSVRVIATSLDQSQRDPSADPIARRLAHGPRRQRGGAAAARRRASRPVVALLARAPGIDRHLLDRLGGAGFVDRADRRRHPAAPPGHRRPRPRRRVGVPRRARSIPRRRPSSPTSCSSAVAPLEAVGLLLDAGDARAGDADDDGPQRVDHRHGRAAADAQPARPPRPDDRSRAGAAAAAGGGDRGPRSGRRGGGGHRPGRRHGRRRRAGAAPARRHRVGAGPPGRGPPRRGGADRRATLWPSSATARAGRYARAHEVLAECAATSDAREDLQRAAESYRVAAAAWESCGEFARARSLPARPGPRRAGPARPLRRGAGPGRPAARAPPTSPTPSARGRVMVEGFVLLNANRLDSAESRFARVADLGYVHDNPRLIAARGVGPRPSPRPAAATCDGTLRWIANAENTALGEADDVLGVPFLCDVGDDPRRARRARRSPPSTSTGPPSATRCSPARCSRRRSCSTPARACSATSTRASANTLPASWWRVKLVAAHAAARGGDLDRARRLRRRGRPGARRARVQRLRVARRGQDLPRAAGRAAARRRAATATAAGGPTASASAERRRAGSS